MREILETELEKYGLTVDYSNLSTFSNPTQFKLILIEEGDVLWRYVSQKNMPKYGMYWVDQETMSSLMSIFRSWGDFSMTTKKELVRNNLAILENWSKLNWRMKVEFKKPMLALSGIVGAQKFFGSDSNGVFSGNHVLKALEHRIGGFNQYIIPAFSQLKDFEAENVAPIVHFAHL